MPSQYISVSEVSEALGCSRMTVLRLIESGTFIAHKLAGKKYWLDKNEVANYVARKRNEAMRAAKSARTLQALKNEFET